MSETKYTITAFSPLDRSSMPIRPRELVWPTTPAEPFRYLPYQHVTFQTALRHKTIEFTIVREDNQLRIRSVYVIQSQIERQVCEASGVGKEGEPVTFSIIVLDGGSRELIEVSLTPCNPDGTEKIPEEESPENIATQTKELAQKAQEMAKQLNEARFWPRYYGIQTIGDRVRNNEPFLVDTKNCRENTTHSLYLYDRRQVKFTLEVNPYHPPMIRSAKVRSTMEDDFRDCQVNRPRLDFFPGTGAITYAIQIPHDPTAGLPATMCLINLLPMAYRQSAEDLIYRLDLRLDDDDEQTIEE